ncbi:MAG TPA: GTPase domain-containing protein [Polyangiaceae bacterium]|jgi:signal recognition particle receptor subunit beta|nr:GTPase domain-containing protein [Polyangiaceae bacterium]
MASVNALARELVFKIVYYGPGLGGKTTTLEHLHAATKPEHRGKLVSLATPVDRTLYFDFLPMRLPPLRGMNIRLQLFTVPGQVYFNATRKLVLTGADGVVFVSDSQVARADANLESLENLRENLREQGREFAQVPLVFQHNKRDLPDLLPVAELDSILNPWGHPSFPTCARTGEGIYEALQKITEQVLKGFEARLPEPSSSDLATSFQAIEGGLATAIRDASPSLHPDDVVVARLPDPSPTFGTIPPDTLPENTADEAPTRHLDRLPTRVTEQPPPTTAAAQHPVVTRAAGPGLSFASLWPPEEQEAVRAVEAALMTHELTRAIELCEALVGRVIASTASLLPASEAPRDPTAIPVLLGLNGPRYLAFCATTRAARDGGPLTARDALAAYAFAIEARIARSAIW